MKVFSFLYALCVSAITGWLLTGCAGNSGEATPQGICRIQQYSAVDKAQSYTTTTQTTYTYDNNDNLTKSVATIDILPMTGTSGKKTGNTTTTYTYDTNGFLTASSYQQQTTDVVLNNVSKTEVYSILTSYSYTSGRLSQKEEKYSGTYVAPNDNVASAYTYDANGNLTKIVVTRWNNTDYQETWSYRDNQLTDFVQKTGSSEVRPYTIQDGVITKMVFPGQTDELVVTKTFDDQKRATRIDDAINGQLDRYDVQTWTDAKPATASLPAFKGFPPVDQSLPFSGKAGVLASIKHFYWNSVSKTVQSTGESTSMVQTNAQGFVSNVTTAYSDANGNQSTTYTATYTYTNCQ